MSIQTKDSRISKEYAELPVHNPRMIQVLLALSLFCEAEFKKHIMITSIFRTQQEHDALYAATEPAKRPLTSPHMTWEGVDLRSSTFTDAEITRMVAFLNMFTYRGGKPVALYHKIAGGANHFHIQFAR